MVVVVMMVMIAHTMVIIKYTSKTMVVMNMSNSYCLLSLAARSRHTFQRLTVVRQHTARIGHIGVWRMKRLCAMPAFEAWANAVVLILASRMVAVIPWKADVLHGTNQVDRFSETKREIASSNDSKGSYAIGVFGR